jgi:1,4-dihydroxy-2-naphthoate polyprenyltransferase
MSLCIYLKLLRVFDWVHLLGLAVFGYLFASRAAFLSLRFLISLIIASFYLAYGYVLNECFDNRKGDYVILDGNFAVSFDKAVLLSYIILLLNFIIAFMHSLQMATLVLFGGIIGFFYSSPPFRFKQIAFFGLLCNALCFVPIFLIGYSSVRRLDSHAFLVAAFVLLFFFPLDLIHQLNDLEADRESGLRTTAVVCGVKNTIYLIAVFFVFLDVLLPLVSFFMKIPFYFSFVTLFFSAAVVMYLIARYKKYSSDAGKFKIKLQLRYAFIFYGFVLISGLFFVF